METEMRVWDFADCRVTEEEFDHDLHMFSVTVDWDEEAVKGIFPDSIEDMNTCIEKMDEGESPIAGCWQDGMGNDVAEYFGARA